MSLCHAPRPERSSWEGDIVWATIVSRFMGRFWCSCQCFFKKVIALSEWRHSSFFRCWTAPQFSGNCGQNCEKFKNRRKSLCAPLRIDNWDISKNFYCSILEQVDLHLYNFSPRRYIAPAAIMSNFAYFASGVQKWLGTNKFVCTKSHIGCKFSKIFLGLCAEGSIVVHLYYRFSLWRQMAPQQCAKFRTAFLVNFVPVSGNIASPVMHEFGRRFRHLLEG